MKKQKLYPDYPNRYRKDGLRCCLSCVAFSNESGDTCNNKWCKCHWWFMKLYWKVRPTKDHRKWHYKDFFNDD